MLVRVLLLTAGATGAARCRRGALPVVMAWAVTVGVAGAGAGAGAGAAAGAVRAAREGRVRASAGNATRRVSGATAEGVGSGDWIRRWGRHGGGAIDGAGAWALVVDTTMVVSVGDGLASVVVLPVGVFGVDWRMDRLRRVANVCFPGSVGVASQKDEVIFAVGVTVRGGGRGSRRRGIRWR